MAERYMSNYADEQPLESNISITLYTGIHLHLRRILPAPRTLRRAEYGSLISLY